MKTRDPEPAKAGTTIPGAFRLRLWLPGYHTPSGNDTIGKHWSKVYRMKKAAGGHLLAALPPKMGDGRWEMELAQAKRILAKIAMGVRLETRKGKRPARPLAPARLRIERVCVSVCDEDNFKGGTKGLVDCLRYAFPSVLLDDAPGYVVMEHVQTRCGKRCEEGTWVSLECGTLNIQR